MIEFLKNFVLIFSVFCIFYTLALSLTYFMQILLSFRELKNYMRRMKYSDFKNYQNSNNMIPISVLVPAYNESEVIVGNIKSLLNLNYPEYEVIVINDGSTDDTKKLIIDSFHLTETRMSFKKSLQTQEIRGIYWNPEYPNLVFVDKVNGGKADALNAGINVSKYPIFASIDADSLLEANSLIRIGMTFIEDPKAAAVGGIVRILNGSKIENGILKEIGLSKKPLAIFQTIEYLRAFLSGRVSFNYFSALMIVSGAFGAFRKKTIIEIGGYKTNTIGEDMEIIVKLHKHIHDTKSGDKIKFIPDPVCWTQAPESIKDLRAQRRRWNVGMIDTLLSYKQMIFNPKYKKVGTYAFPYYLFVEFLGPIVEFLGYIVIPLAYLFGMLSIHYFIIFFIISNILGMILSLGGLILEERSFNNYSSIGQLIKLIIFAIVENFGFRQLITIFRLEGIVSFRKYRYDWAKLKRQQFNVQDV